MPRPGEKFASQSASACFSELRTTTQAMMNSCHDAARGPWRLDGLVTESRHADAKELPRVSLRTCRTEGEEQHRTDVGAMRLGVEAAVVGDKFVPGDVEAADGVIARYGLGSANGRESPPPGWSTSRSTGSPEST